MNKINISDPGYLHILHQFKTVRSSMYHDSYCILLGNGIMNYSQKHLLIASIMPLT